MCWIFKRVLRKETSINCVNYLNKFLSIRNYLCSHVDALFKEANDGFTVKVKNIYIQVQKAVNIKRIVTRLALFQLSEGQSRSSNGSHQASN